MDVSLRDKLHFHSEWTGVSQFMETQMNSFNEQAKILGETYTKVAQDALKSPLGMRK
jgi:hypothetical protein